MSEPPGPIEAAAAALRSGERERARALLLDLLRADATNARAWLWLSGVYRDPAEQRYCLEQALAADPALAGARRGLQALAGVEAQRPGGLDLPARPAARAYIPADPPGAPPATRAYINPWLGIWGRPRLAMSSALLGRSPLETALLSGLAGVSGALGLAAWRNLGDQLSLGELLALALLAGPPMGWAALLLAGVLLRSGGRWLGGRAGAGRVRAALAWAGAPPIAGLLLWMLLLGLAPAAGFSGARAAAWAQLLAGAVGAAQAGLWLWAAGLALVGVSEAHRIGLGRAALAWLAAAALVVGGALCVVLGSVLLIDLRGG